MAKVREKPEILRTDKMEIRVYLQSKEVAFFPLTIHLGQIVPVKLAKFRLKASDFEAYPNSWHRMLVLLENMINKPRSLQARAPMEMPDRNYLRQSHAIE